jgi:CxxC-x17-CxxC domain-containing protein
MAPGEATLMCRDCNAAFSLSEDERQVLASRGHSHPPSRCPACRAARRTRQAQSGAPRVAPGFRELREVRTTVACSSCGESAVVPFAARSGRPVYCSACFRQRRAAAVDV